MVQCPEGSTLPLKRSFHNYGFVISLTQLNSSPSSLLVYSIFHNTDTNQLSVHIFFLLSQKNPVSNSFWLEKVLPWPTYALMSYFTPSQKKYKSEEDILPMFV